MAKTSGANEELAALVVSLLATSMLRLVSLPGI